MESEDLVDFEFVWYLSVRPELFHGLALEERDEELPICLGGLSVSEVE